ncbi:hypothetical protein ACFXO2_07215 [Streptomyces sp. NPDC059152]|uniref:hypothetical protein n=1 Tax=Streptomyces sp. NPDC059152 TaxID=3346742 RepID=UPI0036B4869F
MSQDPEPGKAGAAGTEAERLERIEALLAPAVAGAREAGRRLHPAWRRVTRGEPRWPSTLAVAVAVTLQWRLPDRLAIHPEWLLPGLETALLLVLVVVDPFRIERVSRLYRWTGLALIAMISAANGWSAVHLVIGLVRGTEGGDAGPLLATGGSIWATNVIVFALWYWEWDRGGPVARVHAVRCYPDFLFPQMATPEMAPEHWEPQFADYLYLSFTNATAFSPTDVMPLTRWAKLLMLLQSAVSLLTVVLVVARAVNILK